MYVLIWSLSFQCFNSILYFPPSLSLFPLSPSTSLSVSFLGLCGGSERADGGSLRWWMESYWCVSRPFMGFLLAGLGGHLCCQISWGIHARAGGQFFISSYCSGNGLNLWCIFSLSLPLHFRQSVNGSSHITFSTTEYLDNIVWGEFLLHFLEYSPEWEKNMTRMKSNENVLFWWKIRLTKKCEESLCSEQNHMLGDKNGQTSFNIAIFSRDRLLSSDLNHGKFLLKLQQRLRACLVHCLPVYFF